MCHSIMTFVWHSNFHHQGAETAKAQALDHWAAQVLAYLGLFKIGDPFCRGIARIERVEHSSIGRSTEAEEKCSPASHGELGAMLSGASLGNVNLHQAVISEAISATGLANVVFPCLRCQEYFKFKCFKFFFAFIPPFVGAGCHPVPSRCSCRRTRKSKWRDSSGASQQSGWSWLRQNFMSCSCAQLDLTLNLH